MKAKKHHLDTVLKQWFPLGEWIISAGPSGMNNTTHYINVNSAGNHASYVLRIYETHRDEATVRYEHAVLIGLAQLALPFSTPVPIATPNGESFLRLEVEEGKEAGKLASLFQFIAGERPDLEGAEQIHSMGRATAQLAKALNQLKLTLQPVYPAYYQLGLTDSASVLEEVVRFCHEPTEFFHKWSEELRRLAELLAVLILETPALQKLPHQLIHGDLNASNALAGADHDIAAILDFEFTTMDLRVMEVAVCLSDLIAAGADSGQQTWDKIDAYISGYGSVVKLTFDEVKALPMLIQLRRLDVFVHFLRRYKHGIDPAESVEAMIRSAIAMDKWLKAQREILVVLCKKHLLQ